MILLEVDINPYWADIDIWIFGIIVIVMAYVLRITGTNILNLFICTMAVGLVWVGRKPILIRFTMGSMYILAGYVMYSICRRCEELLRREE